ncbi:AbrB/MazE/SpoVT family DNA-binding domain-containing protein [Candidatus Woesearchaeota archaeon]|nr:AbrB/MazE/SpoVT family DNA-binding domain-containing protein [Candidatus Woesearchaeota archaeon]
MTEIITVGEKGQIVIPKKIREELKIIKGTKLIITEDKDKISIKPIKIDERHLLMLLSETSLKKTWNNKYDERWDDVL